MYNFSGQFFKNLLRRGCVAIPLIFGLGCGEIYNNERLDRNNTDDFQFTHQLSEPFEPDEGSNSDQGQENFDPMVCLDLYGEEDFQAFVEYSLPKETHMSWLMAADSSSSAENDFQVEYAQARNALEQIQSTWQDVAATIENYAYQHEGYSYPSYSGGDHYSEYSEEYTQAYDLFRTFEKYFSFQIDLVFHQMTLSCMDRQSLSTLDQIEEELGQLQEIADNALVNANN